jgi:hypothetical protein
MYFFLCVHQNELLLVRQGLLWRQRASLGPRCGKGLLPKLGTGSSYGPMIGDTFNCWEGGSDRLTQGFRSTPEMGCPGRISLSGNRGCQPFQAEVIVRLSPDWRATYTPCSTGEHVNRRSNMA